LNQFIEKRPNKRNEVERVNASNREPICERVTAAQGNEGANKGEEKENRSRHTAEIREE